MPARAKRYIKRTLIAMFSLLLILSLLFLSFRDNIHTVTPGKLYRSAQLSPSRLERLIQSDRIRTVINLRGPNPHFDWYRDEVSVSRSMGVQHYDVQLSSTHLPNAEQLRRLITLFQTVPKPILLHCQGGADRTGFAVAMWLLMQGHSVQEAKKAYSILYFVHDPKSIGKQAVPMYQRWLSQHGFKTNKDHFLQWVAVTKLGR